MIGGRRVPDQWGALCRCGVPYCARRKVHDAMLVRRTRRWRWWRWIPRR